MEEQSALPTPGLSVLMPVHNGEAYLPAAVDSLLAQTYRDFEIVVVDDSSTDGTAAMLASYARRDPRLIIIRNDKNVGPAASVNRGLQECSAPLIARADADDIYAPGRLAQQVDFMQRHSAVGLLGSSYHRIDAAGRHLSTVSPPEDHATIRARQAFINSFCHSTIVFRAETVRAVGGYDLTYSTAEDSDLWVRLRDRTRFANIPEVLVSYRVHSQSMMKTRDDAGRRLSLSVPKRVLTEYLARDLTDAETHAVVTLYQGFEPMRPEDVRLGLPLLQEVLHCMSAVEPRRAVAYLKREAARSLIKQSRHHSRADRALTRSLLRTAFRFDARAAVTREGIRRTAAAVIR